MAPSVVLVVAPHPDDESFGVGGLVAAVSNCYANKPTNAEVSILFLTSGGKSHTGCCGIQPADLEARREEAAKSATALLGVRSENLHFFRLGDGQLPHPGQSNFGQVADRIVKLLLEVRPDAVYAPHPLEGWSDHLAAERLTRRAIELVSSGVARDREMVWPTPKLFHYCVWFWFSMPLRFVWRVSWRSAVAFDGSTVKVGAKQNGVRLTAHEAKLAAMKVYLEDICPCGRPSCGVLPEQLLSALKWDRELFFRVGR